MWRSPALGFPGLCECSLFDTCAFSELRDTILGSREGIQDLWYSSKKSDGYVVSRFIENLNWYLIIDNDTTLLNKRLALQLLREILIVMATISTVLITIPSVIRRYNKKIIELTVATERCTRQCSRRQQNNSMKIYMRLTLPITGQQVNPRQGI